MSTFVLFVTTMAVVLAGSLVMLSAIASRATERAERCIMEETANRPRVRDMRTVCSHGSKKLYLEADPPGPDEYVYRVVQCGDRGRLYVGKCGPYVMFYAPGPGGSCGSTVKLRMEDGRDVALNGPWSSREGVLHEAGHPPIAKVFFTESKTGYATVSWLKEEARRLGYTFDEGKILVGAETYYQPTVW